MTFEEELQAAALTRIRALEALITAMGIECDEKRDRISQLEAALREIRDRGDSNQWVYSIIRDALHSSKETKGEQG